jgi:hypothetical protein
MASVLCAVLAATLVPAARAQTPAAPREEKLLNGLRLMVWNDARSAKVSVRARIHAGAAFDPLGKEGVMKLLSDIIFPGESAREYFRDDLGGRLDVVCNYDYIQIEASGDSDKFLQVMETLSAALTNPQINPESTARVKAPHLTYVNALEQDDAYRANRAVAKRLLGNFPYGRPAYGTPESVGKIDFADLIFARERFLTSDNATLAISGNVKADFALRAARRLFGGWLKSDKRVPSTFAQPETPKPEIEIIDATADRISELRFAMRGVARGSKDFYAAEVLSRVLGKRAAETLGQTSFVRSEARFLPGIVIIGVAHWRIDLKRIGGKFELPPETAGFAAAILKNDLSAGEFENARGLIDDPSADITNYWLDSQTYRFVSVRDDQANRQSVSLGDVQRVLEILRKSPAAGVLVTSAESAPAPNQ